MNKLIFCFILLVSFASKAQNWQCVQPGVKRYFTNSNNYLRGIRIDSVKVMGTDTLFYSFRTPRGAYDNNQVLDSNGGSWVGKVIKNKVNGDFLFDSYWGDSVLIRSLANLNDTWNLYGNPSGIHYEATVVSVDTATLLGQLDSIKIARLIAKNGIVVTPTDPLHNAKIIWSKTHGFVKLMDFYMFPLHEPGKAYQKGFDYFTDVASPNPDTVNAAFRLSDFDEPDILQVYDFNVGDRFMYTTYGYSLYPGTLRAVYQKNVINSNETDYLITTWYQSYSGQFPYQQYTTVSTGPLQITSQKLFDTAMPEEFGVENFYYYSSDDTSYCRKGLYGINCNQIMYQYMQVKTFEPSICRKLFKKGLGEIYSYYLWGSGAGAYEEHRDFRVYKSNNPCGPYPELNVSAIKNDHSISISPNPVSAIVTIQFSKTAFYKIEIVNTFGQVVKQFETNKQAETISVSDLSGGIYYLSIVDENGVMNNQKLIVQH